MGAVLAACAGGTAPPDGTASDTSTSAASTACAAVERPPEQDGGHLLPGAEPPIPWSSTPGTSGWHDGGEPRMGVFRGDDALTESQLVLALEVSQIVAAYDPDRLASEDVGALETLAREEFPESLTVTPFTERPMDAPLVLNAWGARQACNAFDADAVRTFVRSPFDPAGG